jgi:hypothetical protein
VPVPVAVAVPVSEIGESTALGEKTTGVAGEGAVDAKAMLRANTAQAIAHGVFGVPAYVVEGRLFWGFDGLAMLRASLREDSGFDGPDREAAGRIPSASPLAGGRVPAS